jgi:hypothetical protein
MGKLTTALSPRGGAYDYPGLMGRTSREVRAAFMRHLKTCLALGVVRVTTPPSIRRQMLSDP